ncbi:fucosyltransferase CAZy family GT37-like protein [Selaginella moellendorffii]|uniref:Fucosyltransferase n=1 Tax=Selaginella moellendorffii TaxID=88036 RepID=D8S0F5_SELML|nr:probable fucosyltransferase 8 [Selaginella moellendorffii]EFJ22044.1 fucosyltransferase CAZy family GT37-like protein [Selaginella moellendorffii]|eukprot:XP_024537693.1 probable fucosyltransferase 8 [Selaginella moellendorffii]
MDLKKFWLPVFIGILVFSPCDAANSRNSSAKNWSKSLDATFPEQLRRGLRSCATVASPGEGGVCKILAAMDEQLKILAAPKNRDPPPRNSCKFKSENGASLHRYATDRSPALQALLDRYSTMHSACVARDHDNLHHIIAKNTAKITNPSQCRYIVWSCTFGLGNKLMSLVSTFLYAILSQRVLLLEESPSWDRLFCEPFIDSHWKLPRGLSLKDDQSISFPDFYARCRGHLSRSDVCRSQPVLPIVFSANTKPEEHRFLVCPSAMASVRNIPVLNFRNSNQYFAAGFFLNPSLRPILEAIFPERRVFHNLAGFLLNPSDEVWGSIQSLHSVKFRGASRRIAVQLRESKGDYRDYYDASVPRCIRSKSGLCPIEIDEFLESKNKSIASDDYIAVYVASLVGEHAAKLNASLRDVESQTGQRFELVTLGADEEQRDDVDHQQRALVDIWSLSLADVLLTSHMSTFGYTAQGLAGLTPYFLKPWRDDPCWPSVSSDPCFHFAPSKKLSCREDGFSLSARESGGGAMACPDLPDTGMQLLEP